MGGCCDARGCDEFFSERVAKRDAEHYRSKGLSKTAQQLVDLAARDGIDGMTVLEVGGGVGAIQLELLERGATRTTNVELSPAYEPYAAQIADAAGLSGRSDRRILDFAVAGDTIDAADVVVLHRVICCYPDLDRLLGAAADHAGARLLLTFPRRAFWTRTAFAGVNLVQWIRRRTFRVYVHAPDAIASIAAERGLHPMGHQRGVVWESQGFARAASAQRAEGGTTAPID
jgi:magnesium-protoporphyrin O-methyltransferase